MSVFEEIYDKFIKVIEGFIPELAGRIAIFGQQWQEPEDGKPYVMLTILDPAMENFTEGEERNEWVNNFSIVLDVYGKDDRSFGIAQKLAFCSEKVPFINSFFENRIGVFCDRKIKPVPSVEGQADEHRYAVNFTLHYVCKEDEGTRKNFESVRTICLTSQI
jgi:hypothetical protein